MKEPFNRRRKNWVLKRPPKKQKDKVQEIQKTVDKNGAALYLLQFVNILLNVVRLWRDW